VELDLDTIRTRARKEVTQMRGTHVALVSAVLGLGVVVALVGGSAYARYRPEPATGAVTASAAAPVLTPAALRRDNAKLTCPVDGKRKRAGEMIPAVVGGEVFYGCSPECIAALRRDPAHFKKGERAQLGEMKAQGVGEAGKETALCPICGGEARKADMLPVSVRGTVYYACCENCVGPLKSTPEKYIRNLPGGAPPAAVTHNARPHHPATAARK
jgi:YHS domain-containing protein